MGGWSKPLCYCSNLCAGMPNPRPQRGYISTGVALPRTTAVACCESLTHQEHAERRKRRCRFGREREENELAHSRPRGKSVTSLKSFVAVFFEQRSRIAHVLTRMIDAPDGSFPLEFWPCPSRIERWERWDNWVIGISKYFVLLRH